MHVGAELDSYRRAKETEMFKVQTEYLNERVTDSFLRSLSPRGTVYPTCK